MTSNKSIAYIVGITIGLTISLMAAVAATEPRKPDVYSSLDKWKESKVNELSRLPSEKVFERLKDIEFVIDQEMSYKAVYQAFKHRKEEAISLALNSLRLPAVETRNGKIIKRLDDIRVARKILEVFPEESVRGIVELYQNGSATTRGNIIRVLGKLAGGSVIETLLIEALNDKTTCEEENPEVEGDPLRICDIAYNQLVLRHNIKKVLRAIGPVYRVEVRDYHIDILKNKLKSAQFE